MNNLFKNLQFQKPKTPSDFKVVVIMTAYNEEDIIIPSINYLLNQKIYVYVIENWSTDNTYKLLKQINNEKFIGIERYPKSGPANHFNWQNLLLRVEEVSQEIEADWFIHNDIDSVRTSPWEGFSLRDAIYRVDSEGYNAIDYINMKFHPTDNGFKPGINFEEYFKYFEFSKHPANNIQIQTWKNIGQKISLANSGGHEVKFIGRKVYPLKFLLKHYPIRSQNHGEKKILKDRKSRWNPDERKMGWHNHYDDVDENYNFLHTKSKLLFYDDVEFKRRYQEDNLYGMNIHSEKASETEKYTLSPIDLENPKTSHDYQILLTGERKKVLELGPATGYISNILKIHDCQVVGIENDPNFAKQAKKILDKVIVGDIEELDLKKALGSKKFDVILIGDVLEHLKNPEKLLQKLPRFLAKDGYLVCSIPNITHGSIRLKLLNGEFAYKETGLLDKTHLRFYTLESIISLFDSTGYSITELNKVKEDLFGADGADINPNSIPGELIEVLLQDEESTTFQYVFKAFPEDVKKLDNKKWLKKITSTPTKNLKSKLGNYISQVETLQKINLLHTSEIQEKDSEITSLQKTSKEKDSEITSLQKTSKEKDSEITSLQQSIETHDKEDLSKKNKELQDFVVQSEKAVAAKQNEIETLQKSIEIYQNMITEIHQSFVFRMLKKYDNSLGKVFPLKPKKYLKSTKKQSSTQEQIPCITKALTNTKLEKKDIVCFPIINWDYRFQRPQHIISKFAERGHRIFYFTVNLRELEKPYEIKELGNNIYQIELSSPKYFDIYKDKLDENTINFLINSFNKLRHDIKLDAFCFVEFPTWTHLVLKLRDHFGFKIIFDCLDDFESFPNVIKERKNEEEILMKESDLVLTTSHRLLTKAEKFTKKTLYLPNAGEFDHFKKTQKDNILKNYKKPIIGYFGSIAEWFDNEIIEFVAQKRPDLTFVMIGNTYGSDIRKLNEFENVNFLGERPYSELPKYLQEFDVCLIPFKITPLIQATHPVKIYEYFAAGKPVVCTNMPELHYFENLCYIAQSKMEFLEKIDYALNEKDADIKKKRIEFASKNTWDHRFDKLYSQLQKIPDLRLLQHNYDQS